MIIKAKPLKPFFFKLAAAILNPFIKVRFNKTVINGIDIKPGHSYILMCNHFSFADGFFAFYLCNKVFWAKNKMRRFYTMVLKKQMQSNLWLQHVGAFSVDPRKRSVGESLKYAAETLSTPGNLLLFFPQGNLESHHITHIHFEDGLKEIIPLIKGPCQLIWCSTIIEFFESTKPSIHYNMLDCGTNETFDFEALKANVNTYHLNTLNKYVRFTDKPIS
jgi:1-acyl-sn-glycerol-3-phosphate acyltransferase